MKITSEISKRNMSSLRQKGDFCGISLRFLAAANSVTKSRSHQSAVFFASDLEGEKIVFSNFFFFEKGGAGEGVCCSNSASVGDAEEAAVDGRFDDESGLGSDELEDGIDRVKAGLAD